VNVVPIGAPRLVADLMSAGPVVVRADAPLAEAARLMDAHGFSGLPVTDGAGALVGVISETDLLRARATDYLWASWTSLKVRHLMTSPALTIQRDQPVAVAARKMERHHVDRLVVVGDADDTRPIGILATSDLVRAMSFYTDPAPADEAPGADEGRGAGEGPQVDEEPGED
jgi:CBS domain-containing protein